MMLRSKRKSKSPYARPTRAPAAARKAVSVSNSNRQTPDDADPQAVAKATESLNLDTHSDGSGPALHQPLILGPSSSMAAHSSGSSHIWIVGSSIIRRAQDYCNQSAIGSNLSLESLNVTVNWSGRGGLKWEELDDHISLLLQEHGTPPRVLIIHCGGNSIGLVSLKKLQLQMKSLMGYLHQKMSNTLLVWSNILPRKYWLHMISSIAAEQARIRINSSLGSFVCKKLNGALIRHPDIDINQPKLFQDYVHLSKLGNFLFTNTIKTALVKFLTTKQNVYPCI
ncbi:uncharacterized protein LOC128190899 isoform X1 [Crassostrea angulata]|uniref:uncharacterized protein LOC128190899 isoform X1 n=1 Tax=Magallana angulata TaxID=2784310 RepID=UPI0022B0CCB7|nr:uncharacterized protein LOC128190899 isoform X1 [Crassostrea angulata]